MTVQLQGRQMIRALHPADMDDVLELVNTSGMFSLEDIEEIKSRLTGHLEHHDESVWITYEDQGLEGIAYCIPEPMTNGAWNLLMLLVREDRQGQGHGAALVSHVERALAQAGGRLLLVETSGTEDFENAQRFYGKCGFAVVARIPDFYDAGDDKVIFTKALQS